LKVSIVHMGFFYSGGGERVALEQARYLRKRGHVVKVFSPIIYWNKCFPDLLAQIKPERLVPHLPFPFPFREGSSMLASAILPFGIKKVSDCDILLCHSQPSMWLGYRVNKLFGTPYVGYLHQLTSFIHRRPEIAGELASGGDFLLLDGLLGVFGKRIAEHLDKLCHITAARLLFNSHWTKELFQELYGVTGYVCYPGIDTPKTPEVSKRRNELVIASRHYPWKRIDLAFSVLRELQSRTPQLVVTGRETAFTSVLKNAAAKSGLNDHIIFTGYVDDLKLAQLYSGAKAYVQTSIHEPFGLSPLEAQSYSTPAVVWGDAGVKETVQDGETGYHAKPYDVKDFAGKVDILLSDQERWRTMSRNAKVWASRFTWDSHIDLLEGVLDEQRR
jgi:glycosyltransferase involved in cell wall biosynthesis